MPPPAVWHPPQAGDAASSLQAAAELLVDEAGIGATGGALHDLPDQEPEERSLPGPILRNLGLELREHGFDLGPDEPLERPEPPDRSGARL